jgi:hypothetical protein
MKVRLLNLQICFKYHICFQVSIYVYFEVCFEVCLFTRDRGFIFFRTSMIQIRFQKISQIYY